MEVIHGIVMTVVYFGVGYITSALWYHSNKFIDRFGTGLLWPLTLPIICHGIHNVPCAFCYKANTGTGTNMSIDTFKKMYANTV